MQVGPPAARRWDPLPEAITLRYVQEICQVQAPTYDISRGDSVAGRHWIQCILDPVTRVISVEDMLPLQGLEYLHANHVVHGDLKPANLLRGGDGRIKIVDFGSALEYQETVGAWDGQVMSAPPKKSSSIVLRPI